MTINHSNDNQALSTEAWQPVIQDLMLQNQSSDGAHDLRHARAVHMNCQFISSRLPQTLRPAPLVMLAAAYLHDIVNHPKDHPERHLAAEQSAELAGKLLTVAQFPAGDIHEIKEAIASHSFSGRKSPCLLSAKILQDADRIESLGAFGLARAMMVGGQLGSKLMAAEDPFCEQRQPDGRRYVVDHLISRQLTIARRMNTEPGRQLARVRVAMIEEFLDRLRLEALSEIEHVLAA